jgi:hypothetical protein
MDEATTPTLTVSALDVEARDTFERGVLDVIRQVCAGLIGRGVVDAEDLQATMKKLSDFWRERGLTERPLPADTLAEAFGNMAKIKREVSANIFPTAPGRN